MKFQARRESNSGATGGGVFLKLEDGDEVRGVFRGEPYDYKIHWPKGSRSTPCSGEGCALCKAGDEPRFRFKINFVTSENGALVAKIFEQGWPVYKTLMALQDSDYDLEKTKVLIKREGEDKQTKYTVVPVKGGDLTPESEAQVAAVKLHDLAPPAPKPDTQVGDDDEIPF